MKMVRILQRSTLHTYVGLFWFLVAVTVAEDAALKFYRVEEKM